MSTVASPSRSSIARTFGFIAASVAATLLLSSLGTSEGLALHNKTTAAAAPAAFGGALRKASEAFVENLGQWDAQALFLARSPGVDTWVTERGVVYDFYRIDRDARAEVDTTQHLTPRAQDSAKRRGHIVRMEFVGGKPGPVRGESLLEGRYNYFIGNDESKWASNVPRFAEAKSERVYDGVEARWYFDQGRPRYDLIVAPGADPSKIQMRFEGAHGLSTDGKTLKIRTNLGDVEQARLFAFQKIDGATRQVPCRFTVQGGHAGFQVGSYDRNRPLVIDPLLWSTLLGGNNTDSPAGVVEASDGSVLVAGTTYSTDFPTTSGAYDRALNGIDVTVSKFDKVGQHMLWSTLVGGDSSDLAFGIDLSPANAPIVVGYTNSLDFPTTAASYSPDLAGAEDAFCFKLSSTGTSLVFGTFIGGSNSDSASVVAVDSTGKIVVGGSTFSGDFPTTAGAFDTTQNSPGLSDAFVAKLSSGGAVLLFSTVLGTTGSDTLRDLKLTPKDSIVGCGYTNSPSFPTTVGSFDTSHNGGDDVFAFRLRADGATLKWSTVVGGSGDEYGFGLALDKNENVGVVGMTSSSDFPTIAGALDRTQNGDKDGFALRLSASGQILLGSTFLGTNGSDRLVGIAFDPEGKMLVAGHTSTNTMPATTTSFEPMFQGGGFDAYFAKLSANGTSLLYGSHFGGAGTDLLTTGVGTGDGEMILIGTTSDTVPFTGGGFDMSPNGSNDTFIARVAFNSTLLRISPRTVIGGIESATGTVVLPTVAPAGGQVVKLATTDRLFSVPTSVTVPEGQKTKNFLIKTYAVEGWTVGAVSAKVAGREEFIAMHLFVGGLIKVSAPVNTIKGGTDIDGTVWLSFHAPASGRKVTLSSSQASLVVPSSVTVPEGINYRAFPIKSAAVTSRKNATITAKLGNDTRTFDMTINP